MSLKELQRDVAAALMTPLTAKDRLTRKLTVQMAARWIKPNDRLTSRDRLEIYSRSYWFRLLDSLHDDFPGLASILGWPAFERLATAYLADCPSGSYTLRDLGSRLEAWLRAHSKYAGKNRAFALDMVRLEWAHIHAFDGPQHKALGPEDLIELTPKLRVGLQPYISLLDLQYPVDDLRVKLNAADETSGAASNVALKKGHRETGKTGQAKPQAIFLAVHRLDLSVYYKRLSPEAFRLLRALRAGQSIEAAIGAAFTGSMVAPDEIGPLLQTWFAAWAEFGWLTTRPPRKRLSKRL